MKTFLAAVGAVFLALASLGALARMTDEALAEIPDDIDAAWQEYMEEQQ